jgi:hypothetical protein
LRLRGFAGKQKSGSARCELTGYAEGMKADDLTREQAHVIADRVAEMARYLLRLRKRMYELGFPEDDTLYELTGEARHHVHMLWLDLHGRSASGISKPPKN